MNTLICPLTKRFNQKTANQTLALLFGILLAAPLTLSAATVWSGPRMTYTQPGTDPTVPANQDRITPSVWITRGGSQGIFNAVSEIAFAHFSSPANTEWANGTTANYNTLSYTDWNSWAKGVNAGPESTVGIDAVVHLKAEDIYIDIKFLAWGSGGFYSSGFSYSRSTPAAANNPPSVTVTNPVNGASFTAPCTLTIAASASDSDGTVTNVQFFDGAVSLGSVAANPFSVTRTCQAGTHVLKAVATDNLGASTTSSIVTITVTNALPGALSIQNQGDSVVLNWTGSFPLQTATSLGGSNFVDIAGVTNSPYTNLINTSFRLFRLRGN